MEKEIMTSRDVMSFLSVCENTLLKLEKKGIVKIGFRLSNRKRYFLTQLKKDLEKRR
jgi:hypothetical protein